MTVEVSAPDTRTRLRRRRRQLVLNAVASFDGPFCYDDVWRAVQADAVKQQISHQRGAWIPHSTLCQMVAELEHQGLILRLPKRPGEGRTVWFHNADDKYTGEPVVVTSKETT